MRYLAAGYTLLIVYASLYPFVGWRDPHDGPFDFLFLAWPPYYTVSDLLLNVLGYIPLGLLLALVLLPFTGARGAAILSTLGGTVLSVVMEAIQHYISVRVASNLDVLTNSLGAMLGALLAVTVGDRWLLSGNLYRLRQRMFLPGAAVDLGFALIVLWLFTQLNPEVWLFGTGDLRPYLALHRYFAFDPASYRWLETAVTALNLAAICLLLTALGKARNTLAGPLLALICAALLLKTAAAMTLFRPGDAALWLTPGSMLGIPAGLLLYLALAPLPRALQAASAAALLLTAAALINLAPGNPYLDASVRVWRHGHFLSFNGVTQLAAALWPAVAALYLGWLGIIARRRPQGFD